MPIAKPRALPGMGESAGSGSLLSAVAAFLLPYL
jgi:hypothetical protein